MNWLCVIILAIPVLYIFHGFQKGMVRMAVSFLAIIVTLAAGFVLNPYMEEFLKQKTEIYSSIQGECKDYILDTVKAQMNEEISQEEQKTVIEGLPLPDNLIKILSVKNDTDGNGNILAESFAEYLSNRVAQLAVGAISLFLTFLLVSIAMSLVGKALNTIVSFPVLSSLNRMGGAALGGVKGICIVWILFLVIAIFWNSGWARDIYDLIKENPITNYLYEKNMFMHFLNGVVK